MLDQDIPMVQKLLMCSFVQRLKSYVIWVQTGVIQVGFYLLICPSQYERTRETGPTLNKRPTIKNELILISLLYLPTRDKG